MGLEQVVWDEMSVRKLLEESQWSHVKIGICDIDGVLRGKYLSLKKLLSALENNLGFCNVILGWDSSDSLYDNVKFTGWHTAYPDAPVHLLPETLRKLPFENDRPFLLGEFTSPAEAICPRGVLRRVIAWAQNLGFSVNASFEYEFFLFKETPDSVRAKHYRNLKTITPANFGYSVLRSSVWVEFYDELMSVTEKMNLPIEGLHTETGPGVIEAALEVDSALAAADKAVLFKTIVKILAQRRGLMATFMAKWSDNLPGQSGHIHLSLHSHNGDCVFYDPHQPDGMSTLMRHFVAGQQRLMPELLALVAPTVNSFSRLVPGYWAPTFANWGIENRTTALRVISGSPTSQRIEYRIAAADANPYLALAAALASGLWGIEHRLDPTEPICGNAYEQEVSPDLQLPMTLWDAAQRLRNSQMAATTFGKTFTTHFAATREWEEREFRRHVTDWELARYFEII